MKTDTLTVVAISALAYLLATFLHEAVGHGLSCVALGGKAKELSAFYFDCDYSGMGDFGIRAVALAGPLVSLLVGLGGLLWLRRTQSTPQTWFFAWLFMSIGFMIASGYLLFSGFSGIGDFGTDRNGALYRLEPEWLWRSIITVLGALGYWLTVRVSLREMERVIGGGGQERVSRAQGLALTAYLTGGILSVLIGFLNPYGLVIVLTSAAAASLGGTSALAWEMQLMDRRRVAPAGEPTFTVPRSLTWLVAGGLFTLLYALILGPSLRF